MRSLALLVLVFALGCNPAAFNDLGSDTPVRVVHASGSFPAQTFGTIVTTYKGIAAGVPFSRIVVSSGDYLDDTTHASVWAVLGGWRDKKLDLGATVDVRCNSAEDLCAEGEGASLAPLHSFGAESACVMAGAPFVNEARVKCESSNAITTFGLPATATGTELFGASIAAVPETSTVGIAFIGAPGADRVALVRDAGDQNPGALDLGGQYATTPGSRFGEALAVATLPETFRDILTDELLLVVGEPGSHRVVVLVVGMNDAAGGVLMSEVLGCVDRPTSPEFGSVVAAGDLTNDGIPEILVGARLAVADRADEIVVFSADQLSGRKGCQMPTVDDDVIEIATQAITCDADGLLEQYECTDAGLGSAFAIGNIDGTGANELLASLPLASVDQVAHAGAAFVFPTAATVAELVTHGPLLPLVDSSPGVNDTLGFSLAYLPTQLGEGMAARDEPVVASPGANRVYVFLCSGLAGDALSDGTPRCLIEQ